MARRIIVWDLATRIFHWSLVTSFFGAYLSADSDYRVLHVMFGYTILGLIGFRLLWGFVGPRYARFSEFVRGPLAIFRYLKSLLSKHPEHYVGHNPAGAVAIVLLLFLGILVCTSGLLSYDERWENSLKSFHALLSHCMLAIVFVHIGAAIISGFLHHENLVLSMLTGYKEGEAGQSIVGTRPWAGLMLAAAIASFWMLALPANPFRDDTGHGEAVATADIPEKSQESFTMSSKSGRF
ncbi:cytochrome b/b6 domain-containing protein [Methylococcus geothermalis]|uniref:Cytochrome B n=1 Tax=Methylococcus geothermalis TaxID=2681310 RepID=A0A858Q719_9GAMM|nr:cytochrome b/b6 domain-containing protein [Methylococcus geothermalis]QJD29630.1 cytochrome B [Methylococcus geothermalis]